MLDHPLVQARLHLPPDQFQQRPESQIVRSLYDCPEVPVGPGGVLCRVVGQPIPRVERRVRLASHVWADEAELERLQQYHERPIGNNLRRRWTDTPLAEQL